MKEAITHGIETFNKTTVALKNVFWLLVGLALVVLFWANTNSHISDSDIHLTPEFNEKLIILLDDFEELVDRVEKKDKRVNAKVDELRKDLKELHK